MSSWRRTTPFAHPARLWTRGRFIIHNHPSILGRCQQIDPPPDHLLIQGISNFGCFRWICIIDGQLALQPGRIAAKQLAEVTGEEPINRFAVDNLRKFLCQPACFDQMLDCRPSVSASSSRLKLKCSKTACVAVPMSAASSGNRPAKKLGWLSNAIQRSRWKGRVRCGDGGFFHQAGHRCGCRQIGDGLMRIFPAEPVDDFPGFCRH